MISRDFCYWLQGYFEISVVNSLDAKQVGIIRNHLNLVFEHEIDPSIDGNNKELKKKLQKIHDNESEETTYRC